MPGLESTYTCVRKTGATSGIGDNLFICSIVALNADTGKYIWHYQESPGDHFEYDATATITLADLKIGGRLRKVLMQAPKDGFFYVLDRSNGQLLSLALMPDRFTKAIQLAAKTR